jgi:hypothetical protein
VAAVRIRVLMAAILVAYLALLAGVLRGSGPVPGKRIASSILTKRDSTFYVEGG